MIEYFNTLSESIKGPNELDFSRPVWIFGTGSFGLSLSQAMNHNSIEVAGFVETNPNAAEILNKPVLNWENLAKEFPEAQIALGIFNRNTPFNILMENAEKYGFKNLLMPWDSYDKFSKHLGWRYWLSQRSDLIAGLERISKVAFKLADHESRNTLRRITAFRLGQDLEYASEKTTDNQYFNEISLSALQNKEINYVDCGAYNGDTYLDLLSQKSIKCGQSFLMEPDPVNFKSLVTNIEKVKAQNKALCLPLAAAEKYSMLNFSSGFGESGNLSINGNMNVAAVSLDELLHNIKVDFIKLDVEGAELQALKGAKEIINNSRPVLAISIYHNPQDIWLLPEYIFSITEDYKYFIRQHHYNSFDSVFYAVPNK